MAIAVAMSFGKDDTDVFSPPNAGGTTMSDESDDDMAGHSDPPRARMERCPWTTAGSPARTE
eukprot:8884950-Karenia_brevis.AAC.1